MKSKPFKSYIICTTPRSGSTLLCKLLARTKIAGDPDSHFHGTLLKGWLDDYGLQVTDFATEREAISSVFQRALVRGKGNTDIFGLRVQRESFGFFMQQLAQHFAGQRSDRERIESAFGPTLFVHLSRPNRLDQAISRVLAEQTGLWHRNSDGTELERLAPPQEPQYDASAIKRHMAESAAFDEAWERWFEQEAVEPLRINYDDLSKDPQAILRQLLKVLNLDPSIAQSIEAPTAKLADSLSCEWRVRFEKES